MSSPAQKRASATSLRTYADTIEQSLNDIPGLSHQAWDCPARDSFDAETSLKQTSLETAAGTLRSVAALLDQAAATQEAAEAAAAEAAAASALEEPGSGADGSPPLPVGLW